MIKCDSRKVNKGDIFIALRGINSDGHDYIEEAIKNGACALITQRKVDYDIPYVIIENLDEIWPSLYEKYYDYPQKVAKTLNRLSRGRIEVVV